ncbi:right-handed parallel beta-helix repeat-containing protein [Tautonia plasticadhaerens]|uniref:Right handed beta helix domain-containing protein n=1 Tax=Tautonia plasticadhaerens TaxID=2527974 RepID=A0A518HFU3_9BACT|nr:hypothetical protein [Tautonia plasticadhaerens]QDV39721.1 hypothetical protein ElP_76940 [Tautonia plasticadhaerens]
MTVILAIIVACSAADRCPECGWQPRTTETSVEVGTAEELIAAVGRARPNTTIFLRDGVYQINRWFEVAVPDIVIRGRSGDRNKVVLRGPGVDEHQVGTILSVGAPRVTIADLSVGLVAHHGVQVRGELGADDVELHNLRVVETGQQLVKGSMGEDGRGPHRGLLSCSTLEYVDHAPSSYTNGVDVLGGRGWVVRDCVFRRIRGPEAEGHRAGPAVLFWHGSRDTIVERNLVLDCYRGIAFGLEPRAGDPGADHLGGVIRRNAICNRSPWADEAIEVGACPDVLIDHNTVLVEGKLRWSISVRFPETAATVRNNLTNNSVAARDGARLEQSANILDARPEWFVDPDRGDLRLVGYATPSPGDRPGISGLAAGVGAFEPGAKRPTPGRQPDPPGGRAPGAHP